METHQNNLQSSSTDKISEKLDRISLEPTRSIVDDIIKLQTYQEVITLMKE